MSPRRQVQIHNNPTIFPKKTYAGINNSLLDIQNGARLVLTLYVFNIDSGASVEVKVKDSFSVEMPTQEILTFSKNSIGHVRRILSDFHNLMDIELEITGGSAELILGVSLYDNALSTNVEINDAEISVDLNSKVQPNGKYDSVRIGDKDDELEINPDGSINVNIVNTSDSERIIPTYNEISGVLKDIETKIVTYTAKLDKKTYLQKVEYGGNNVAKFVLKINDDTMRTGRTYFGGLLKDSFDFNAFPKNGLKINPGEAIDLYVTHYRPFFGSFEGYIQILEID